MYYFMQNCYKKLIMDAGLLGHPVCMVGIGTSKIRIKSNHILFRFQLDTSTSSSKLFPFLFPTQSLSFSHSFSLYIPYSLSPLSFSSSPLYHSLSLSQLSVIFNRQYIERTNIAIRLPHINTNVIQSIH